MAKAKTNKGAGCNHCQNQAICKVKDKADDLLKHALRVMGNTEKLYAMLSEGIAEECDRWEKIQD